MFLSETNFLQLQINFLSVCHKLNVMKNPYESHVNRVYVIGTSSEVLLQRYYIHMYEVDKQCHGMVTVVIVP